MGGVAAELLALAVVTHRPYSSSPRVRPWWSVSLTSSIDFLPKFGIAASSSSRLDDQVADRLDADALQAVVGADAELELLDREVLHPVRERRLRRAVTGGAASPKPSIRSRSREDRELADQDLGGLADRLARVDEPSVVTSRISLS